MQIYKYKTIISEDGVISLPNKNFLFGKQVEITIKPIKDDKLNNYSTVDLLKNFEVNAKSNEKHPVDKFLEECSGILKDIDFDAIDDSDDPKFQYLKEKYLCNK